MAKKEKDTICSAIHPNGVIIRSYNREISILRHESKERFAAPNVIFVKALTANAGKDPGVKHNLSNNEKIKYSALGLSDEALIELYMGLSHYVKNIINNQTK